MRSHDIRCDSHDIWFYRSEQDSESVPHDKPDPQKAAVQDTTDGSAQTENTTVPAEAVKKPRKPWPG